MVSSTPQHVAGYFIDSDIFIADERRKFDLDGFLHNSPPANYFMSAVTAAELLLGIELATPEQRAHRQANVDDYIAAFPIFDFDVHCALHWTKIAAPLRAKGQSIGAHDLLIAATALRYNYGVITFNAREFSRIPGLVVIRPHRD